MSTDQSGAKRWDAIPVWGTGWFVAVFVLDTAIWFADQDRAIWLGFVLLPVAGAAAVGLPTFMAVRTNGSRAPRAQALVWIVGFTIAAALVMNNVLEHHRLGRPGEVNVNTTETMRQRQASFSRWGKSPEVMASFFFSIGAIFSLAVTTGIVSGIIATTPTAPHRWPSILGFGFATGLAMIAGLWSRSRRIDHPAGWPLRRRVHGRNDRRMGPIQAPTL